MTNPDIRGRRPECGALSSPSISPATTPTPKTFHPGTHQARDDRRRGPARLETHSHRGQTMQAHQQRHRDDGGDHPEDHRGQRGQSDQPVRGNDRRTGQHFGSAAQHQRVPPHLAAGGRQRRQAGEGAQIDGEQQSAERSGSRAAPVRIRSPGARRPAGNPRRDGRPGSWAVRGRGGVRMGDGRFGSGNERRIGPPALLRQRSRAVHAGPHAAREWRLGSPTPGAPHAWLRSGHCPPKAVGLAHCCTRPAPNSVCSTGNSPQMTSGSAPESDTNGRPRPAHTDIPPATLTASQPFELRYALTRSERPPDRQMTNSGAASGTSSSRPANSLIGTCTASGACPAAHSSSSRTSSSTRSGGQLGDGDLGPALDRIRLDCSPFHPSTAATGRVRGAEPRVAPPPLVRRHGHLYDRQRCYGCADVIPVAQRDRIAAELWRGRADDQRMSRERRRSASSLPPV